MATEQLGTFSGIAGQTRWPRPPLNHLAGRIDRVHVPTLAMGLLTMTVILLFRRTRIRSLGIFVAVAGTSVVIAILGGWAEGVILVQKIAPLPSSLPAASLPQADAARHLTTAALAVALLGLVQTVALSQSLKEPDGRLTNASREFIGQGLSNIAAGLFQGLPSGGSLSRTAVNVSAGARTRLANVWAGLLVAVIMLLFSDLAGRIASRRSPLTSSWPPGLWLIRWRFVSVEGKLDRALGDGSNLRCHVVPAAPVQRLCGREPFRCCCMSSSPAACTLPS